MAFDFASPLNPVLKMQLGTRSVKENPDTTPTRVSRKLLCSRENVPNVFQNHRDVREPELLYGVPSIHDTVVRTWQRVNSVCSHTAVGARRHTACTAMQSARVCVACLCTDL